MHPNTSPELPDPIIELLTTYNELNASSADELLEEPSALEFMRYVARNRPFVIRGGAANWQATKSWNVNTLKELLREQSVNVAVTPKGCVVVSLGGAMNGMLIRTGTRMRPQDMTMERSYL
jgi:Asp-tRNA(Asn)/Glu-tRNA(Gln) amidotransferase B subunit